MGVNKDKENSVLNEQPELLIQETVESQSPVLPRKTKHRQNHHFCPRVLPKSAGHKSGGHKRTRRYENTCFLMSLVDDNDFGEVTISDFVESSQSVFEKLLSDRDSLEIWNDFMNRPEDEQEIFLQQVVTKEAARKEEEEAVPEKEDGETKPPATEDAPEDNKEVEDKRTVHPAQTPEESFLRINSRLRTMLRRKHLPKGMLKNHEDDLVPWFTDDPGAVYISHIHCSYDRLLLHAVCQYLDLQSISYDCNNQRHTKVENSQDYFRPPELLLSQYLDSLAS